MSTATQLDTKPEVVYPDSDGQPMAENTVQYRLLTTIKGGFDILFENDPSVFVAGDLFWYPVEGSNAIRVAPDVMVIFGRPKGDRGSYMQWREDNIAPQVVFEIISPGNRSGELARKLEFYERYGVEECYFNDPELGTLSGWQRARGKWRIIPKVVGWTSPRLNVRFELNNGEIELYGPDGIRFKSIVEVARERKLAELRAQEAIKQTDLEHRRAEQEHRRAEQERQHAEQERQRAEQQRQRAEQQRQRAEQLAAQLRALGVEPEQGS